MAHQSKIIRTLSLQWIGSRNRKNAAPTAVNLSAPASFSNSLQVFCVIFRLCRSPMLASVKRSSQFMDSGKRIKLRLAEVTELIWDSNMLWKQTSLRRIP